MIFLLSTDSWAVWNVEVSVMPDFLRSVFYAQTNRTSRSRPACCVFFSVSFGFVFGFSTVGIACPCVVSSLRSCSRESLRNLDILSAYYAMSWTLDPLRLRVVVVSGDCGSVLWSRLPGNETLKTHSDRPHVRKRQWKTIFMPLFLLKP